MSEKKYLSRDALKLIAIAAMTIDHIVWTIVPGKERVWYIILPHIIGRITASIMWFFIAEGCWYTHNRIRYLLRLFLFAVISHFAYCFAFGMSYVPSPYALFDSTSVIWGLFLASLTISVLEKKEISLSLRIILSVVFAAIGFASDWSSSAVLAPVLLYYHRGDFKKQSLDIILCAFLYSLWYFCFHDKVYGVIQLFTVLSLFFLNAYNGEKGRIKGMKWFFYIYYPLHLFILGILRVILEKRG